MNLALIAHDGKQDPMLALASAPLPGLRRCTRVATARLLLAGWSHD